MPSDEIYGLTREDRDLLDNLHRRFGTLRENAPSSRLPFDMSDDEHQAPEVYVALVPPDGIPACEGPTGTGGPSLTVGDIPGSALCGIYKIVNGVIAHIRQAVRVYNLSDTIITTQWVTIKRDKFGTWFADTGANLTPCPSRNEVWMIVMSIGVLGGSFDLTFFINNVEDTITVPAESTATEVKDAFATHSELVTSDLNVVGGPLPGTSVRVEFVGTQAGTPVYLTSYSGALLNNITGTGTGSPATESGLLVVVVRWQSGFTEP